jgi:hypothetical protein
MVICGLKSFLALKERKIISRQGPGRLNITGKIIFDNHCVIINVSFSQALP